MPRQGSRRRLVEDIAHWPMTPRSAAVAHIGSRPVRLPRGRRRVGKVVTDTAWREAAIGMSGFGKVSNIGWIRRPESTLGWSDDSGRHLQTLLTAISLLLKITSSFGSAADEYLPVSRLAHPPQSVHALHHSSIASPPQYPFSHRFRCRPPRCCWP